MIELNGKNLTLERFGDVVEAGETVALAASALERIDSAHRLVEEIADCPEGEGEPVYGINTGFGDLARVRIPSSQTRLLQERLVTSHAAGVGEPLPDVVVRGMLLLRANTLARGYSGASIELIERLIELLNRDLLPIVPSRGSVGASGDLAPLAHLALPVIGLGSVRVGGVETPTQEALAQNGLSPLQLGPKEGLALINGTQAMTAILGLAAIELRRQTRAADLIGALTTEALLGTDCPFDPRLHELRPHAGQIASARNLWQLMQGSEMRESHRQNDSRVQDPYSVRCMPQVHGAVRDVLTSVETRLEIEFNAVTDNPLVFAADREVISGGNFHGEPMAMAADFLAIAASELASISERRIDKLTDSVFSGLPPFLVEEPGLNSGFMIAQVTAAALVSENKVLCHPASVDSIPTSAEKEDHVSMGMGAALKLRQVVANVRTVQAIELLAAAQGIDLRRPLKSSDRLEGLHGAIRSEVPKWIDDRVLATDIEAAERFLDQQMDNHTRDLI